MVNAEFFLVVFLLPTSSVCCCFGVMLVELVLVGYSCCCCLPAHRFRAYGAWGVENKVRVRLLATAGCAPFMNTFENIDCHWYSTVSVYMSHLIPLAPLLHAYSFFFPLSFFLFPFSIPFSSHLCPSSLMSCIHFFYDPSIAPPLFCFLFSRPCDLKFP